ncbi:histidine kinase dimerization/phospho-acceptor domain-containing protein [Arcticibacter svalbardensis]|uniref:histidine kinase dimerization/phospho-acceptor domain-containing protein n=1 Tax=Arcticibacter svalbardensis TaxID=1288027 RepID=UPI000A017078
MDFFTNVAHKIRTPLNLIQAPLERIISKVDEVPAIKKNILVMERKTRRLLKLTEQLLDFRSSKPIVVVSILWILILLPY